MIGLAGFARSGKDSVASFLCEHHGFARVAFADQPKKTLYDINPEIGLSTDDQWRMGISISYVPLQILLEYTDWEGAKKVVAVREMLQRLGVAVRNNVSETAWIDAAFKVADQHDRVVFPDVRFLNEADAISACGGKIVRVERPGVYAINDHVSEHEMDDYSYDATVRNWSTIHALGSVVERVMEALDVL